MKSTLVFKEFNISTISASKLGLIVAVREVVSKRLDTFNSNSLVISTPSGIVTLFTTELLVEIYPGVISGRNSNLTNP